MKQFDGGPAFPKQSEQLASEPIEYGSPGMSLRYYFAAKAMAALIQANRHNNDDTQLAKVSYAIANAMIEVGER